MALKKPSIQSKELTRENIQSIKENIEILTGRRGKKIALLAANASLTDTVTKLNEVLALLQG